MLTIYLVLGLMALVGIISVIIYDKKKGAGKQG